MFRTAFAYLTLIPLTFAATPALADLMQVFNIPNGDTLNVRAGPGGNHADIGDLQQHDIINVVGIDPNGQWAEIRYRGREGWVSTRYLRQPMRGDGSSILTGPHVVTGIKAGDPDGGLVVRNGDGTSFARLGVLRNNTEVHVIQRSRDKTWAMISYGSGVGWVSAAYLNTLDRVSQPTPQPMPSSNPQTAPDGGSLPGTFTVSGVAANDVLWVRDRAQASGAKITSLAPGSTVRVLGMATATWAQVSVNGMTGFVNARFLTRRWGSSGTVPQNGFRLDITCQGTEPFWTLGIAADRTVTYTSLINGQAPLTALNQTAPSAGGGYPYTFGAPPYSGVISQGACSDGMSSNAYSMSITLNKPSQGGGIETVYGCCNVN